jgi:hypothetical protein
MEALSNHRSHRPFEVPAVEARQPARCGAGADTAGLGALLNVQHDRGLKQGLLYQRREGKAVGLLGCIADLARLTWVCGRAACGIGSRSSLHPSMMARRQGRHPQLHPAPIVLAAIRCAPVLGQSLTRVLLK